jgi:mRNA interferase MazF
MDSLKQLDIYWVNLEPTIGAETQKQRPCVILQQDLLNQYSNTTIIAPILPGFKTYPFAVNITKSKQNGLDKDRHINLKQLRVVAYERISNQQGRIERKYLPAIQQALQLVFGF